MEIIFPWKNVLDARIDHRTAACEVDTLLIIQLGPVIKVFWLSIDFSFMDAMVTENGC